MFYRGQMRHHCSEPAKHLRVIPKLNNKCSECNNIFGMRYGYAANHKCSITLIRCQSMNSNLNLNILRSNFSPLFFRKYLIFNLNHKFI
jgi:hypothetical protein